MIKQLTALILSLCMVLSLVSCGKKKETVPVSVDKSYASQQALDVFQTIDAIRNQKDASFSLQVNHVDKASGVSDKTLLTVTGSSFESLHQAELTVELDGTPFTDIQVRENELFINVKQLAESLSQHIDTLETMSDEDKKELKESVTELAGELTAEYALFRLPQDPWTGTESGVLSDSVKQFTEIYKAFQSGTASLVQTNDKTCTLTLTGDTLKTQLLQMTDGFYSQYQVFEKGAVDVLTYGCSEVLAEYGFSAEDIFANETVGIEELKETLEASDADQTCQDWTLSVVSCGDEASGYTLDWTKQFDKQKNYVLSVYPAQAQELTAVEGTPAEDMVSLLADLYTDLSIYRNNRSSRTVDSEDSKDDEDLEDEYGSLEDLQEVENTNTLETQSIDGYSHICLTEMRTEDGVVVSVPVPVHYDSAEVDQEEGYTADIFLTANGYDLEYTNLEARSPKDAVTDNVEAYQEIFGEDYGYTITQKGKVDVRGDGKLAIGGMGYYDSEEKRDVTVITAVFAVEGSDYAVGLDIFLYSHSVTNEDIDAVDELMKHLGVNCPVEITKN